MIRLATSGLAGALALGLVLSALPARAQRAPTALRELSAPANVLPQELENVGVVEHLGEMLPLDVKLTDSEGRQVELREYFGKGRPVVLNLGYYGCPMLCGLVIKGLTNSIKELDYLPGREFDVVTVSIDPKEDTKLAKEKRASVLEELGRPGAEKGWFFHTAEAGEIERLAQAVGFQYRWDEKDQQWAHAASIAVISPDGKIARYLYGIEYPAGHMKLAVLEASEGKVGKTIDRLLLFCFHYDDDSKEYVLFARNLMRLGGVITLVTIGALLLVSWRRERSRKS